jgi:hypothetical protein
MDPIAIDDPDTPPDSLSAGGESTPKAAVRWAYFFATIRPAKHAHLTRRAARVDLSAGGEGF